MASAPSARHSGYVTPPIGTPAVCTPFENGHTFMSTITACTHLCVSARISSSLARAAAAPKSPPPSAPSRASSAANRSSSPKKSEKPALWYDLRRRSGAGGAASPPWSAAGCRAVIRSSSPRNSDICEHALMWSTTAVNCCGSTNSAHVGKAIARSAAPSPRLAPIAPATYQKSRSASAIVVAPDTVTAASARSLATHHAATSDAASSRGGDARVAVRGIAGRLYAKRERSEEAGRHRAQIVARSTSRTSSRGAARCQQLARAPRACSPSCRRTCGSTSWWPRFQLAHHIGRGPTCKVVSVAAQDALNVRPFSARSSRSLGTRNG